MLMSLLNAFLVYGYLILMAILCVAAVVLLARISWELWGDVWNYLFRRPK